MRNARLDEAQAGIKIAGRNINNLRYADAAAAAYLRLLIFLPEILIPACDSFSPTFCMMYSTYKLNKDNNVQPCHTPFPIWNQSAVPCPVLTVAS